MKFKFLLTLALCSISIGDAAGQLLNVPFLNAKLKHNQRRIFTVLVLPSEIRATKAGLAGLNGPEGRWKDADQVEDDLQAILCKELAIHGAQVLPNAPLKDQSDEAWYTLADLQRKYDAVEALMLDAPKDITKGRFTLGDAMDAYVPAASADTVVFIRGSGLASLGWKIGGHVGFVDARTGEVLALIEFTGAGLSQKANAETLTPVIDAALQNEHVNMYSFLGADPFKRPGAK